ncbi:M10 family metallopeptidase C-terminal domain-containing protein [Oceanicella sp. SM1341]|uniref:M10 family metallopeptidase C-terminal domain-containing protein n=1 Tax=Oceanicella sp. SM1341 TaxID=1548889 RepID=UPI000E4C3892|nr:M10 family metallopeptidase C-terminal domain-containing protein [Oceanicella sp. SM1341]
MAHEPDGVIDFGATPDSTFTVGSGNQAIDGLLSGSKWTDPSLTYSFPDSFTLDYPLLYPNSVAHTLTYSPFSATQAAAAESWLSMYAAVSGLGFAELDGSGNSDDGEATLKFGNSDDPGKAYTYGPAGDAKAGDMFFDPNGTSPQPGDEDWHSIGSELGHALGLKDADGAGGIAGAVPAGRDAMEYTIMSERSFVGAPLGLTNAPDSYAQSLMMLDIRAIQQAYGADFSHNAGNTTYSFSETTGEMFVDGIGQGAPAGNVIFRTVWDGDGYDTYDFSNYSTGMDINLSAGGHVDVDSAGTFQAADLGAGQFASGQVYNALLFNGDQRSLIEAAIGGSGDDTLSGNNADNDLRGGAGADTLSGFRGEDRLFGGDDDDVLRGQGRDDRLHGGGGDDMLYGGAAFDSLYGGWGEDTLMGGKRGDLLVGGGRADMLYGQGGNDVFIAGHGNDMMFGGQGKDLYDASGHDGASSGVTVDLHAGTATGPDGWTDTLDSFESVIGTAQADMVTGSGRQNVIRTGGGDDMVMAGTGDDTLFGGAGNDTLDGELGDDVIGGGNGSDTLFGSAGNDRLTGGGGNDLLDGGIGDDVFVFTEGFGVDTITSGGFETGPAGGDVLDFSAMGIGAGMLSISDTAQGVQITVAPTGDVLFIEDVTSAQLDLSDDFLF